MSARPLLSPETTDDMVVRVCDVKVGIRRRKSVGSLAGLMKSIQLHGLFHPILLRNGNELVAGGRRLAAFEKLGISHIPARSVDGMSDEELRAIEEEENAERLDLSTIEASKARFAEMKQAEADQKKAAELATRGVDKSERGRGRPKEAVSRNVTASVTGIAPTTQRKIEAHVAAAEEYPALARPGWVRGQALQAADLIEKLPEADRPKAAALIDQPAIPPADAIPLLKNLAEIPASERKAIFTLAESDVEHERLTALARAAAIPDPIDPGLTLMGDVVRAAQKAAKYCHAPEFKPRVAEIAEAAAVVLKDFRMWNEKKRGRA